MHWTALAATLLAAVYFACMGWGVKGHFVNTGGLPGGMKATTLATALAFAWFLEGRWEAGSGRAHVDHRAEAAASGMILVALGLFWWAVAITRDRRLKVAFLREPPSFLVTAGPYAWVRHPFYTSYLLFWTAAALASPAPAYWLVPVALALLYGWVALREEAGFASSGLAAEYDRYRRRTGMLLPVRGWSVPQSMK